MENRIMILNNPILCQKSNSIKLNFYSFGYAVVDTTWNGFVKSPSFSRLYYIINGEAYIEYDNIKLVLLPGNWYLIPAELSFRFWCDNEMEHLFFHITISTINEIDLFSKIASPIFLAGSKNTYMVYEDYLNDESLFASLAVKEKVYNILLTLMDKYHIKPEITEPSQCVQKAVEFINNNLNHKLDLNIVAKHTYVSKSTLTNKFKSELKITAQEYILRQKMLKAVQLLKSSNISISEISERLGFSDQFYFSKCFKNKFGLAPREYRKSKIN